MFWGFLVLVDILFRGNSKVGSFVRIEIIGFWFCVLYYIIKVYWVLFYVFFLDLKEYWGCVM